MSVQEQAERKPKIITIFVNNKPVELTERDTTGGEIKQAAGVPREFKLYGPRGNEIADDERLKVHEREKFTAISGVDVS